jgi:AraC-like DNA-binding protein
MAPRRNLAPEVEHELARRPNLGYEPLQGGVVRCIEHGSPTPLERWHCHDEYELQLIVGAHGRAFVGDYVGHFEPGHLVLTGPRLPHNWISTDLPPGGLAVRSLVLQFLDAPLRAGMAAFPELEEVAPLFERARHGVEFFGLGDTVQDRFHRIKSSRGLERLGEFVSLLCVLARWPDYRLLSAVQLVNFDADPALAALNRVVEYVNEHVVDELSLAVVARVAGMSESRFSRYFARATGSTFSEFVTRLRVNKACELLMRPDLLVQQACYQAGFNNLANFNRRFLEMKGVTPSEFRRQVGERFGTPAAASVRGLDH